MQMMVMNNNVVDVLSVLQCVHSRYEAGHYYTWAGPTLVAVNPCHPVDHLYTHHQIQHHHQQVEVGHKHTGFSLSLQC